jgi:hypothetical protein
MERARVCVCVCVFVCVCVCACAAVQAVQERVPCMQACLPVLDTHNHANTLQGQGQSPRLQFTAGAHPHRGFQASPLAASAVKPPSAPP